MAGLFKKLTTYVLGGGDDNSKLDTLITKMDTFQSDNWQLYCKDPEYSTLVQIFKNASASFNFDTKTHQFSIVVENLEYDPDEDWEDEKMIELPLTKAVNWEVYAPAKDTDKYICGHILDYSNKSEKNVGTNTYQLEFTSKEKKTNADLWETIINDILDYIDSNPTKTEETKESQNESSDEFLFKWLGHLLVYNKEQDRNDVVEENVTFVVRQLPEEFKYAFTVFDKNNEMIINTKIHEKTQTSIQTESGVIMWIHDTYKEEDDELDAYLFYFLDNKGDNIASLSKVVSKCVFESQRKVKYEENVDEEDMDWMADTYVEGKDDESKSEYNDDEDMYEGLEDEPKEYLEDENQLYENNEMIQAHTYDRTFVARGDGFGVYSACDDDKLNYYGDFPVIKEYSDVPVKNMLLYENENKLLFLNPKWENKIQWYDFEKNKVVEEWEAQGVKSFNSFFGETKNAQSTSASNVIACSDKGLYLLDPRINKSNKTANSKVYSANYLF